MNKADKKEENHVNRAFERRKRNMKTRKEKYKERIEWEE